MNMILHPNGKIAAKEINRNGNRNKSIQFPTPSNTRTQNYYRILNLPSIDSDGSINEYHRNELIKYSLMFYNSVGKVSQAFLDKARYSIGNSWIPRYYGDNLKYKQQAEEFLFEQWMPISEISGMDWQTALRIISLSIDIYGDCLVLFSSYKSGFPTFKLYGGNKVGNRNNETIIENEKTIDGYNLNGFPIENGVVFNPSTGKNIAYRILGNDPNGKDDVLVSTDNSILIVEKEYPNQKRGFPKIAKGINQLLSLEEIQDYFIRQLKLASSVGLIKKTQDGYPNEDDPYNENLTTSTNQNPYESIEGGSIYYLNATMNESIESIKNDNPSLNNQQFSKEIENKIIHSIDWLPQALEPEGLSGRVMYHIQDKLRTIIKDRQYTIRNAASTIINYIVCKASKEKYIPITNDWFKWKFTFPKVMSSDVLYDMEASMKLLDRGLTTKEAIANENGEWIEDIEKQQDIEVDNLLIRAKKISDKHGISMDNAVQLLNRIAPNPQPITTLNNNAEKI